jgi:hypothetical protein
MVRTDITLDERGKINDLAMLTLKPELGKQFTPWIQICRIGTDLDDGALMAMTNDEIINLGSEVIESLSKKK